MAVTRNKASFTSEGKSFFPGRLQAFVLIDAPAFILCGALKSSQHFMEIIIGWFLRRSEVLGVAVSSADQFSCFCSQEMGKDHWKNNFLLSKYIVKRALWEILVYVFLGGCVQVAGHNSGSHRAKSLGLNTGKNSLAPKLVKGKKVQLILTWLKMCVWC